MPRDRPHPRISLTKLAEYLVASAGRRRAILEDQRFPSAFMAGRWTEAYPAIADVIRHHGDRRLIAQYLAEWRSRVPTSDFEAAKLSLWIQAMTALADQVDDLDLASYSFVDGRAEAYASLAGVEVSMRPDLLVAGDEPGALKIYLGKSKALTANTPGRDGSGTYAAALLHIWAEDELWASPKRCLVLDVFSKQLFTAPAKPGPRRRQALAACQEIALVWAGVTNPRAQPGL